MSNYDGKPILRDENGNPIPQMWDENNQVWIPFNSTQKVKQSGRYVALENDDLVKKEGAIIRLESGDTKPDASMVDLFQYLVEMDTGNIYYSDGTNWQEVNILIDGGEW